MLGVDFKSAKKGHQLRLGVVICALNCLGLPLGLPQGIAQGIAQVESRVSNHPRAHQLMLDNLGFYLDEAVEVQVDLGAVAWKDSEKGVLHQLELIVKQVASLQRLDPPLLKFSFSDEVAELIHYVSELDHRDLRRWRMAEGLTEAEQWYVLTQSALDELKMQIAMELNVHLNSSLFEQIRREFEERSEQIAGETADSEMEDWFAFDPNRTLPPVPLEWSESSSQSFSDVDRSSFFILPESGAPNDWEDWMRKLVQLMEMQEMRIRALEASRNQVSLDDLNPRGPINWSESGLYLPDRIEVFFQAGSHGLDLNSKLRLNEVMGILCRHPNIRLVCTGFADAMGDRSTNLNLSKKRAQVVRDYLLQTGVQSERVLLNYFGEEALGGDGNNQRLVKIQFFMD